MPSLGLEPQTFCMQNKHFGTELRSQLQKKSFTLIYIHNLKSQMKSKYLPCQKKIAFQNPGKKIQNSFFSEFGRQILVLLLVMAFFYLKEEPQIVRKVQEFRLIQNQFQTVCLLLVVFSDYHQYEVTGSQNNIQKRYFLFLENQTKVCSGKG